MAVNFYVFVILSLIALNYGETSNILGRTQSAGARGVLLCHGQRVPNVIVKLFDEDRNSIDDLLASGKTDHNGYFSLEGYTKELSPIDPKLNIYHDCANQLVSHTIIENSSQDTTTSYGVSILSIF